MIQLCTHFCRCNATIDLFRDVKERKEQRVCRERAYIPPRVIQSIRFALCSRNINTKVHCARRIASDDIKSREYRYYRIYRGGTRQYAIEIRSSAIRDIRQIYCGTFRSARAQIGNFIKLRQFARSNITS